MSPVIAIFGAFAFLGLIIGLVVWTDVRRRKALTAIAEGLGWTYDPRPTGFTPGSPAFPLFDQGHLRRAGSLLRGSFGGRNVEVFDYQYTIGSGKGRYTPNQTVVHVEDPALRLPSFSVRPRGMLNRLTGSFGHPSIDLPEHPEFSKHFVLGSPDAGAARALFTGALPGLLSANPGVSVDGGGSHLYVFREGRVVKPNAFPEWLAQADTVIRAFYEASPSAAAPPSLTTRA